MQNNKSGFFKGISFSYMYLGMYLVTGLLVTPLLLSHFGSEYFAVLMLVYAIITYLNNIKLGIPESLSVLMAKESNLSQNISLIKKSLYFLIFLIFLVFMFLLIIHFLIDDWRILLGEVSELDKNTVLSIIYILVIFSLIKIPFEMALSVFIGFHEVYLEKIYKTMTILVNFILVLITININISIVDFVLYSGLLDLLVSMFAFIHMSIKYKIYKKYSKNLIQPKYTFILNSGIQFFQLIVTQNLIWGIGIFIVSHFLTLQDVTIYSLTMKIYIYIFLGLTIVNTVISPLYGKYLSNSNWSNIEKVFNISIRIFPFIGGFVWIGTLLFMSDIISQWTSSDEYFIGNEFVFFMGLFFYVTGYVNTLITFIMSLGKSRDIIFIRWNDVLFNILISSICVYYFGIIGISIGMSISILFISLIYIIKMIKKDKFYQVNFNFTDHKNHLVYILIPSIIITFISVSYNATLFIKLLLFVFITIGYFIFSWKILSTNSKQTIVNLIKILRKSDTND